MTTGKTIALTRWTFVSKVMSLLFNMLSRFVIAFLPRSKHVLISWLQSLSTVILEPKKIKSVTISIFSPSLCHEVMGLDTMILIFHMLRFKPGFSLSSFTFIKRLFSTSSFYDIRVVTSANLRLLLFLPAILIPACASSSPAFLMMYSAYSRAEIETACDKPRMGLAWNGSRIEMTFTSEGRRENWHSEKSEAGEGNGSPLQYSSLENPRDGGA